MKRTVWYDVTNDDEYVKRCGFCGKYKEELKQHWFFSGVYCVSCIVDCLWGNVRSLEEMK